MGAPVWVLLYGCSCMGAPVWVLLYGYESLTRTKIHKATRRVLHENAANRIHCQLERPPDKCSAIILSNIGSFLES